jgi:hypothetical protein
MTALLFPAGYALGALFVWWVYVRPAVRERRGWEEAYWKMTNDRDAWRECALRGARQAMAARAGREPSRN